jgi:flotillin
MASELFVLGAGILSVGTVGIVGTLASRVHTVPASQYMAKTGWLVKKVNIGRIMFKWPFQQIVKIDLKPVPINMVAHNMSKEMVPFELPVNITVKPINPEKDPEGFIRYATNMSPMTAAEARHIIEGVISGETRAYVASMSIQEIFSDKDAFKRKVTDRVQEDLADFGLEITNANIGDLKDMDGNDYFDNMMKITLEKATTKSRVEVSETVKLRDIGEKEREAETRKQRARLEADACEIETTNKQRLSHYGKDLQLTNTDNARLTSLATIEAHKATRTRQIEVEVELNKVIQQQELEKLRSSKLVVATADAEAIIKMAEADVQAIRLRADATLYSEQKKAEAAKIQLEAAAEGLNKMYEVSQTNPEMACFYIALQKGLFDNGGMYTKLAEMQAMAVKDMQPKIHIWNTGSDNSNGSYTDVISNLARTLPQFADVIETQTQIKIPDFFKKVKDSQPL